MEKNNNPFFYLTDIGQNIIRPCDVRAFTAKSPTLRPFVEKHPPTLRLVSYPLFESLCYWIISQQIGGSVANKIVLNFKKAFQTIEPTFILEHPVDYLRGLGLSHAKAQTIQNLSKFVLKQERIIQHKRFTSKEAIAFFTQVKGIGEWTMQMHLIFGWGHRDILAAKDLVVRQGVQILYGLNSVPSEKEVKQICRDWGELSTIGTLLAWAVKGEIKNPNGVQH